MWGLLLLFVVVVGGAGGTIAVVHQMSLSTFEWDFQPGHCGAVIAWGLDRQMVASAANESGKVILELPPGSYQLGLAGLQPGQPNSEDPWYGRPCSPTSNDVGGPASEQAQLVVQGWGQQHLTARDLTEVGNNQ